MENNFKHLHLYYQNRNWQISPKYISYHMTYIKHNMNKKFMNNYLCEKHLVNCKTYKP